MFLLTSPTHTGAPPGIQWILLWEGHTTTFIFPFLISFDSLFALDYPTLCLLHVFQHEHHFTVPTSVLYCSFSAAQTFCYQIHKGLIRLIKPLIFSFRKNSCEASLLLRLFFLRYSPCCLILMNAFLHIALPLELIVRQMTYELCCIIETFMDLVGNSSWSLLSVFLYFSHILQSNTHQMFLVLLALSNKSCIFCHCYFKTTNPIKEELNLPCTHLYNSSCFWRSLLMVI